MWLTEGRFNVNYLQQELPIKCDWTRSCLVKYKISHWYPPLNRPESWNEECAKKHDILWPAVIRSMEGEPRVAGAGWCLLMFTAVVSKTRRPFHTILRHSSINQPNSNPAIILDQGQTVRCIRYCLLAPNSLKIMNKWWWVLLIITVINVSVMPDLGCVTLHTLLSSHSHLRDLFIVCVLSLVASISSEQSDMVSQGGKIITDESRALWEYNSSIIF